MFYLQRSMLAYYYGELCMSVASPDDQKTTQDWLEEAGSWATWQRYRVGLLLLGISFVAYAELIGQKIYATCWLYLIEAVVVLLGTGLMTRHNMILSTYRNVDDPYKSFRQSKDFWADWRRRESESEDKER